MIFPDQQPNVFMAAIFANDRGDTDSSKRASNLEARWGIEVCVEPVRPHDKSGAVPKSSNAAFAAPTRRAARISWPAAASATESPNRPTRGQPSDAAAPVTHVRT